MRCAHSTAADMRSPRLIVRPPQVVGRLLGLQAPQQQHTWMLLICIAEVCNRRIIGSALLLLQ